jgi:hypothetical protein
MGLLDLIQQQHRMRMLVDRLGQQATLVETHIPGGAPISRDTVWRSMYSDMSKRINSMPMILASCRVTSVLPTPVGPANRKEPMGFLLVTRARNGTS